MMDEEGYDQIANLLVCPRDCENYNNVLLLFRRLTPPNCFFMPTKIWSRQTRKKKSCLWCVLYQNPEASYLEGDQAKELRKKLNTRKPIGGEIVDYEFHENATTGEKGWLFIWRNLACQHTPRFRNNDNIQAEELSIKSMVNCVY